MHKVRLFPAFIALCLASSACFTGKSRAVFTPPPPHLPDRSTMVTVAYALPPPPDIFMDPAAMNPPRIGTSMPEALEPPRPVPPARGRPIAPPKSGTQLPAPSPDQPAPPRIVQIFTPEQLREYTRQLNDSLDRVKKVMAAVAGKNLNAAQNEIADRIRTFEKQAEQARDQDLVTAVGLAKRADLLAQDLLDRLP